MNLFQNLTDLETKSKKYNNFIDKFNILLHENLVLFIVNYEFSLTFSIAMRKKIHFLLDRMKEGNTD